VEFEKFLLPFPGLKPFDSDENKHKVFAEKFVQNIRTIKQRCGAIYHEELIVWTSFANHGTCIEDKDLIPVFEAMLDIASPSIEGVDEDVSWAVSDFVRNGLKIRKSVWSRQGRNRDWVKGFVKLLKENERVEMQNIGWDLIPEGEIWA
jgi:hypothetical protein